MSALTSLLVRDDVISPQTVEHALQRQTLAGGDVDTALLELGAVSENVLSAYRAATFGLRAASREEVMHVSDDTLKLLSVEWAHRLRVVPLLTVGGTLVVCAAAPLSSGQLGALEDVVGSGIEVRVAVQVRVEAALAIFYGVQIAQRLRLLADQLDGVSSGATPEVAPLPGPPVGARMGYANHADLGPWSSSPPENAAMRLSAFPPPSNLPLGMNPQWGNTPTTLQAWASPMPRSPSVSSMPSTAPSLSDRPQAGSGWPSKPPRRSLVPKGPFSAERAHALLGEVRHRDDIVEVFFAFARQYFDAAACFALRHGQLYGLMVHGALERERVLSATFPVMGQGAVGDAVRSLLPCIGSLSRIQDDRALLYALGRSAGQPAFLLPIPIRQRAVLLFYGDRDGEPFTLDEMGPVLGMVPETVHALSQVIRKRKVHSIPTLSQRRSEPVQVTATAPPSKTTARSAEIEAMGTARTHVMPSVRDMSAPQANAPARISVAALAEDSTRPSSLPEPEQKDAALSALGLCRPMPSVPVIATAARDSRPLSDPFRPESMDAQEDCTTWLSTPLPEGGGSRSDRPLALSSSAPPPRRGAYRSMRPGTEDLISPDTLHPSSPSSSPRARSPKYAAMAPAAGTRERGRKPRGIKGAMGRPGRESALSAERPYPQQEASRPHGGFRGVPARYGRTVPPKSAHSSTPMTRVRGGASGRPPSAGQVASRSASAGGPGTAPGQRAQGTASPVLRKGTPVPIPAAVLLSKSAPVTAAPRTALASRPTQGQAAELTRTGDGSSVPTQGGKRALATRTPSIIIDLGKDVDAVVEALAVCGPDDEGPALAAVMRFGDVALPALCARFPGPLWFDRNNPHQRLPQGGDVSAIARALSAFGGRAVPCVAELMTASDPDVRFYALLLSQQRVDVRFLPPYLELTFDPDPQVRLMVREALFNYHGKAELQAVVERLCVVASDSQATLMRRLDAIEALSATREPAALETLIELNVSTERQLAVPAHRALMFICGREFGDSTRRWHGFIKEWRGRHRVEWLIAGLTQTDERMRGTCGVELQRATRQYLGYVAGAPKRDRERIQQRYWDWWQSEGQRSAQRR